MLYLEFFAKISLEQFSLFLIFIVIKVKRRINLENDFLKWDFEKKVIEIMIVIGEKNCLR